MIRILSIKSFDRRLPSAAIVGGAIILICGFALALAHFGTRTPTHPAADARPSAASLPAIIPASRSRTATDVIRVIDGDTFEARVHLWPGLEMTTKVRLRGIDAPELDARCRDERVKAEAARTALAQLLAEGSIFVFDIGPDKYGGRVVASAATARTANISDAMIERGVARPYRGGRREGWC